MKAGDGGLVRQLRTPAFDLPREPSSAGEPAESSPRACEPIPRLVRYPDLAECVERSPLDAPCHHVECPYHLAHRDHWQHEARPTRDCAIDVANEGSHTQDEVGAFLGITGERVRQIEERAFEQLKSNATMKGLHDDLPE